MKKLSARRKKWIERTVGNDRSFKLFLYNRFFLFLFLVLIQLLAYAILILTVAYNSTMGTVVQIVTGILALLFVVRIINRNDRPSSKLNWIILILIFPIFGVLLYLFNGEGKPTRKMQKKIIQSKKEIFGEGEKGENAKSNANERENCFPRNGAISQYLTHFAGYPAYKSGTVTYFANGQEAFEEMLAQIAKAEKFIFVEYFIISHGKMWNSILKLLIEKAIQGVQVRIIYDDFGCMVSLPPRYDEYLESLHENIKCMTFNNVVPLFAVRMNNRDHRKMLIIDGKVAFTGGINLADEYINEEKRFGYWKDSALKITGNSVNSFTQMFLYLWNAFRVDKEDAEKYLLKQPQGKDEKDEGKVIHPYDDSPLDKVSVGETAYVEMINRANKYVWIFTPYLVLDDFLRSSLCLASTRGVDVRIVTPGVPDKKIVYRLTRANYQPLLKAGVKIYEYTPGFIHSKSMLCDGEGAIVGTINLDYRSLYHHFENAVYFTDEKGIDGLKRDCEETFAVSKLCTLENTKRGFFGRLLDSLLRVFETLL